MPEFDSYPPGVPCWVDLATSDLDGAETFYGELLGWSVTDLGPDAGGYRMAFKDGKQVAGLSNVMSPDQPPAWSTYIGVEDAEAVVAAATDAGASVLLPPMDVMTAGRMAVLTDPTGAVFSLWQPGDHKGAQLANEVGSFSWNELNTRDTAAAEAFYTSLFGWTASTYEMGPFPYTEFKLGDRSVAGMLPMPPMIPAEVPAHWRVYFSVADTDAAVAFVGEAGGQVFAGPMDIPQGRFAVLADPQGASFAVIAMIASA